MAFLKNLKVDKVSFVSSPANKRKFLLLKSSDSNSNGDSNSEGGVSSDPTHQEEKVVEKKAAVNPETILNKDKKTMPPEIEKKEEKKETPPTTPPVTPPVVEKKADSVSSDDVTVLKSENAKLQERLAKLEHNQNRSDLITWLTKNCPYLPDEVEKTADVILNLEKLDPNAAKIMKDTLQKTSAQLESSKTFSELGSSVDIQKDNVGGDLVVKVNAQLETIRKSKENRVTPDDIAGVVKSMGPAAYNRYRDEFNRRARIG